MARCYSNLRALFSANSLNLFFILVPILYFGMSSSALVKEGIIYATNYTVFSVTSPGRVIITLTSWTGDADLYAVEAPGSASAENYDLSSYSCGKDFILIPHDFARPVSVSIYGHPFAEETKYTLEADFIEVKVYSSRLNVFCIFGLEISKC